MEAKSSSSDSIEVLDHKENINSHVKNFNEKLEILKKETKKIKENIENFNDLIIDLDQKIPHDEVYLEEDEDQYSTKRLDLIDLATPNLTKFLKFKFEVDEGLMEAKTSLAEMGHTKLGILNNINSINEKVETKKKEKEVKIKE